MKIAPATIHLELDKIFDIIDNSPVDEFINFAKEYNIFQESDNRFYKSICDRIKKRLADENLIEDDIKP
jgi:hypothetical protein